jgi:hypothetical protein
MAYRTDEFGTPVGCDALSRAVTPRLSGIDLVDAEKPGKPCQTDTSGCRSLPAHRG